MLISLSSMVSFNTRLLGYNSACSLEADTLGLIVALNGSASTYECRQYIQARRFDMMKHRQIVMMMSLQTPHELAFTG